MLSKLYANCLIISLNDVRSTLAPREREPGWQTLNATAGEVEAGQVQGLIFLKLIFDKLFFHFPMKARS